ncbi:efflux transporter outer membrane subunit [Halopseudomonas pelagia]|uniref:Efflux transporter outer membrane subunit n=1 Tax=Halopseudomonas pelagia TaxID=553151 RepID=A0AA91U305_9GAMM|nr:efflux transporter outer membrane subunit [Halopseudomonas pelagia]PCC99456.1 RND transporter [Halopseudomonas pelagia]QFY56458.1 efflux transporter outer membrane subunit [Halopseudomonas pelagia]
MHKFIPCLLTLALAGCQLAPDYQRPESPVLASYPEAESLTDERGFLAAELPWQSFFADPQLQVLIGQALENNRDLQAAVYRIEETRGLYRVQNAERFPSLGIGADATRGRFNQNAAAGAAGASGSVSETYSVSASVSAFELDFWSRVANLSTAAQAEYFASIEAQRAFRLSLIRDVATTYLGLREAVERIALAEATVISRRDGLRIAKVRLDAGITSALDFNQAEALLTQAETQLASIMLTRAENQNLLAVLTGGIVAEPLPEPLSLEAQSSPPALDAGLSSSLLVNRPDILAAEQRLIAAKANIGIARAAFFPQVSLIGSFGYASSEFSNLISSSNETWSIGPSITLPIFDFGRNRGNLTVAQARDNIAIAEYESTIQVAFNEVADALAGRRYLAEQVDAQRRNTETLQRVVNLARKRYQEGVVNYIEVLDAERSLFEAEQAFIQTRRTEVQNLVDLYVALGGGSLEE